MTTVIRPSSFADDGFVYDSWLRSFRMAAEHGPYPPDVYFPACRTTIERLLARSRVEVLVLEETDLHALLGYIVHERDWQRWSKKNRALESYHIVHFLYVLEAARGQGVARALLEAANVRRGSAATGYSFGTEAARGLFRGARWIPDAARYESRPAMEKRANP